MVAGSLCVDGCGMAAVAPHTPAGSKIYPQYISRRLFIYIYLTRPTVKLQLYAALHTDSGDHCSGSNLVMARAQ